VRSSRARSLLALATSIALVAALGCGHAPTPGRPWVQASEPPQQALPDDMELAAGRLAALVLADRIEPATSLLEHMRESERQRRHQGAAPTGLIDDAQDLIASSYGRTAYLRHAERMLARGHADTELERRLERELEAEPLTLAQRRLAEDRVQKYGAVANRLLRPASQIVLLGSRNPFEAGSVAFSSIMTARSFPEATVKERQALRAYQEFLDRYPESPEADEIIEKIERYQRERRAHEHAEAIAAAERALGTGQAAVALVHLNRAERLVPGDRKVAELRAHARALYAARQANAQRALEASDLVGAELSDPDREAYARLAAGLLLEPLGSVDRGLESARFPPELEDERAYIETIAKRGRAEESAFFAGLHEIGWEAGGRSNMARHARLGWVDPAQNPYRALRAARRMDRSRRMRWLALGRRASGPIRRGLWRPLEWVLDAPGMLLSIATFPLRLVQYPKTSVRFGGPVIRTGEAYLARFPRGEHAQGVRRELESLYAGRGQWSQALVHHRELERPDRKRVARYRERIAERTLAGAREERRTDVRASIYRSIVLEYGETPQAELARSELADLFAEYTPQSVRLSREFLEESPELWGPGALDLRRELFDGDGGNGELAEEGVTLVGGTAIRIELEGAEPAVENVPEENFARFVALLEEDVHDRLLEDTRETREHDPKRDLFLERARLGLVDQPDLRPSARSEAEFLGKNERFGAVRRRESPLPVELVLQGGLEDFGFAAFPRIKLPAETPDAYLYR
jgi:hypothetical protein